MREADLYAPVRNWLAALGYTVKGEVGAADVVACRDGAEPVVVELKRAFSLALVHQGVARQGVSAQVYLAVPAAMGRAAQRRARVLCRRLGLGLLLVRLPDGPVHVLADPAPYRPRHDAAGRARMLAEFHRRAGDPHAGGSVAGRRMTAYRSDALACARALSDGPLRGAEVARAAAVPRATRIMADNHYGWFARVARGTYMLTEAGRAATVTST